MTLSDLSIKRPVFAWILMFALIIFGAISLGRLGLAQIPNVDFPTVTISTVWEGSAPEIMEAELVDQIEQRVISVEGLREMRSSIRQGQATVDLDFEINRDVDAAVQDVQSALSQINLPLGVDPPTVRKQNPDADPIMWIGVGGDRPARDVIEYVELYIKDQFQVVPGVGEVRTAGFTERNLRVHVDGEKLKQYELTVQDVLRALQLEHAEIASGYLENEKNEINLRTMGEAMTPEQVGDILITRRGNQPVYNTRIRLRDVARVEDGLAEVRTIARASGNPGVALGIAKQRGENEVEVSKRVRAKLEQIKKTLPQDLYIQVNVDFTRFSEQSVKFTLKELVVAALVTGLVCFLFLGSWTASVNVLLSIPTSIFGTFTVLYFMGLSLNMFTLLALALSIGIVVDDAIMVLENIVRHFQMGKDRMTAAREGAREITFAAVATSIAVMAIFLPVFFLSGIIGKFLFQFGVAMTAAVAFSLLEAITITPMRCSRFMRREEDNAFTRALDRLFGKWRNFYGEILTWALAHPMRVVLVSMVFFGLSLGLMPMIRKEFMPAQDQSLIRLGVETPVGSSLAYTQAKVQEIESVIKKIPEIERFTAFVGGFSGVPNQAFMAVKLMEKDQRQRTQAQIMTALRKDLAEIKGVRIRPLDFNLRGLTPRRAEPLEFNLRGPSLQVLKEKAGVIKEKLAATGLTADLDTNYREGQPELRIFPDREAAAARGVSMEEIGRTIQAALGGVRQGKFTKEGRRYDVRVRLQQEERLKPEDVEKLQVRNVYGELIPLTSVVKSEVKPTVQSLNRVNRQQSISIKGNIAEGKSQATALAAAEKISREVLPEGYTFNLEGGSRLFAESGGQMLFLFAMGILVAYMVLACQFDSFVHPVTVLMALPFSISGALITLMLFNKSLNLYSIIGIILLAGIVKKNSIMLVEFTNQQREAHGLGAMEALRQACPIRLRPILMTSLATIAAAVPMAFSTAPGAETRVPMAITIIGGVLVSTLFTLVVVPCVYLMFSWLEKRTVPARD
ncbi:MAG: efflux RND transporter permease subunit [Verrucomicrobiae bacterium]|nr:efflux RND transporter permease subunit [Verrucomicrobiae bacterium]